MNTITYKELKAWYLDNQDARDNAEKYFGDKQPSIYSTGYYSAPSWNWGYEIGIVGIPGSGSEYQTEEGLVYGNGIQSGVTKYFEIVTQFGVVKTAREINLPELRA